MGERHLGWSDTTLEFLKVVKSLRPSNQRTRRAGRWYGDAGSRRAIPYGARTANHAKGGMATSGKCRSLGTLATFRDGSRAPSDSGRQGCISQPLHAADHAKGMRRWTAELPQAPKTRDNFCVYASLTWCCDTQRASNWGVYLGVPGLTMLRQWRLERSFRRHGTTAWLRAPGRSHGSRPQRLKVWRSHSGTGEAQRLGQGW